MRKPCVKIPLVDDDLDAVMTWTFSGVGREHSIFFRAVYSLAPEEVTMHSKALVHR